MKKKSVPDIAGEPRALFSSLRPTVYPVFTVSFGRMVSLDRLSGEIKRVQSKLKDAGFICHATECKLRNVFEPAVLVWSRGNGKRRQQKITEADFLRLKTKRGGAK